jgi:hypothetical protein
MQKPAVLYSRIIAECNATFDRQFSILGGNPPVVICQAV